MKFNDTISEDKFFRMVYKKGESKDALGVAKAAISNFKMFCKDTFGEDTEDVLKQLKAEESEGKIFNMLNDFVDWLAEDHPDILWKRSPLQKKGTPLKAKATKSIKDYMSFVRKYMKRCHALKVDDDDFRDYIVYPVDNGEEAEPLTREELQDICNHIQNSRKRGKIAVRKNMIMVKKDTGFRIKEMMQVRKRHFDTSKRPITLTLTRMMMKGKRTPSKGYITKETAPGLLNILKTLDDDDLVYTDNEDSRQARNNCERWWNRLVQGCGYDEKYPNGRLKKNIHSIKAFCGTQYAEANGEEMMHGYLNHTKYLGMYNRLSEEKQVSMFLKAEPHLSIYDNMVVVEKNNDEDVKKLSEKVAQQGDALNEALEYIRMMKRTKEI